MDGRSPEADSDRSVLQIARKLAATVGADFFQAIATHLAEAISADCTLIGEFAGERLRTLAASWKGAPASFECGLPGSAAALVAAGKPCECRSNAQVRFPEDTLLPQVQAHALIGVPLNDARCYPAGLIMALYSRPVASFRLQKEVLEIFSSRAAAELSRKHEEDRLRESEERYRVFIAKNPDAMWRVELEKPLDISLPEQEQIDHIYRYGFLAECNESLSRLWGLENPAQLVGSRVAQIAPLFDKSVREATLAAIRSNHRFIVAETSPVDREGRQRHFLRSQWGIVEDGQLVRIWGITRDITELRRSERERAASERRMADLLESVRLVVVMTDDHGAVSFCNPYFYGLTEWKADHVLGKDWLELMIPPDEHQRLRAIFESAALHPDAPVHFESGVLGPGGRRWQFEWDRTDLRDAEGRIAAWANIGRDVTEFKALEEQFRQAQKLASVGRLAGGVAHDFNNLLTVILGYSSALIEDHDPTDAAYHPLLEIRNAACQGAELTHRLLTFSRRQVVRPQIVRVNDLVVESSRMIERLLGEDIRLHLKCDPDAGCVRADASHLHQVLLNLTVNARDAMPHGGELTIAASNTTIDAATPLAAAILPGKYVEISVADTGAGMTEEVQRHLFEPFFTTKEEGKGTGLGLSTVYGIVQQSGGRVLVESELGKGSRFRIFLPAADPEPAAPSPAIARMPETTGVGSILLVEDKREVREITAHMLQSLGYRVLAADAPQQALDLARDPARTIDMLVTDVVMPGISGIELANLVHKYRPDLKVLFMSGYGEAARVSEKLNYPGFAYLQKPFARDDLARKIREMLARASQQ